MTDDRVDLEHSLSSKLKSAGFVGVEVVDHTIFARTDPATPEFCVVAQGAAWRFAVSWPYRANPAQRATWDAQYPDAQMDVDLGETRVQRTYHLVDEASLADWARIVQSMVAQCVAWRRTTRQGDEGC